MALPNLLHQVPIKIRCLNRAGTHLDHDAREPIFQGSRDAVVIVPGQVNWGTQLGLEPQKVGPREGASGYVLFRRIDLETAGVTLQDNDCFKQLGDVDCDLYIDRLEWNSHYPSAGGPTLVKAYFSDRQPAKQARGVA